MVDDGEGVDGRLVEAEVGGGLRFFPGDVHVLEEVRPQGDDARHEHHREPGGEPAAPRPHEVDGAGIRREHDQGELEHLDPLAKTMVGLEGYGDKEGAQE